MGAAQVSPPVDFRIERCMKRFRRKFNSEIIFLETSLRLIVPQEKLDKLWIMFCKYDRQRNGLMVFK